MNHKHKHAYCNHSNVKYCQHCNLVFCVDCGEEWRQYNWTYVQPYWNASYTYTSDDKQTWGTSTVCNHE